MPITSVGENGIDDIFISIEEAKDFGTWKSANEWSDAAGVKLVESVKVCVFAYYVVSSLRGDDVWAEELRSKFG